MKPTANMKIREIMLRHGITQREIAGRMGVHENTVGRWMRSPMTEGKADAVISIIRQITGDNTETRF